MVTENMQGREVAIQRGREIKSATEIAHELAKHQSAGKIDLGGANQQHQAHNQITRGENLTLLEGFLKSSFGRAFCFFLAGFLAH